MPVTSVGTGTPSAEGPPARAGGGAGGARRRGGDIGLLAAAGRDAAPVRRFDSGGRSAAAEDGGSVRTRALSNTWRSREPQMPFTGRPYCCWSFSTEARVSGVKTLQVRGKKNVRDRFWVGRVVRNGPSNDQTM